MDKTISFKIVGKDDCLTAASFADAVEDFVAILNGMGREIAEDGQPPQEWRIVALAMQSPPVITFAGNATVADQVMNGLSQINSEAKRPKHFTDQLMNRAKHLVGLLNNGIVGYELALEGKVVKPTQHIAANVDVVIGRSPKFYTTQSQVEGRVEMLSVHGQSPEFCVYDPLTNEPIRCVFKPESLHDITMLIERRARVCVSGMMKFNAKHKPVSVDVEKYEPIPEQAALPQLADLHRAKINITGGMDSADFIREQRDGDKD